MKGELVPASGGALVRVAARVAPALIRSAGPKATRRFVEFFTAHIRNPNTRAAYYRAWCQFAAWCEMRGLTLETLEPTWVGAYLDELRKAQAKATVKQHLAAIRMGLDWLVMGQVLPFNPAHAVRGPFLLPTSL